MIAALAAVSAFATSANAQTTLNMSVWHPPNHPHVTDVLAPWAEQVEKATEGRVVVRMLPKPVAAPSATFDAIRNGLADISYSVHGYMPGRFLLTKAVELPFAGDSALAISTAYWRVHEKYFAAAGEHEGIKLLGLWAHGPGHIHNSKHEVAKAEDLRGLKFRVAGGVVSDVSTALGIVGLLKPATDAYMMISTGVADGALFPMEALASFNLAKIAPYTTQVPNGLYNVSFFFGMNQARFDGLPQQDQDAIMKVSGEAYAELVGKAWDAADEVGVKAAKEAGSKITVAGPDFVESIRQATSDIERDWVEAAKAKGVDGAAALAMLRAETAKIGKK